MAATVGDLHGDNRPGGIVGHGIDIVPIERIESMLDSHGDTFIERCFTVREQEHANRGGVQLATRYAGRFAVKEAAMKTLGTGLSGGIRWVDVETIAADNGRPELIVTGVARTIAEELGIGIWHVSISHAGGLAIASVIGSRSA